jgi:hypothetical protein
VQRLQLEIAYILRDQYRDRPDVISHSQDALKRGRQPEVVALSLLTPSDALLDQIEIAPIDIGRRHYDWVTAVHLSAARGSPDDFAEVVLAMISRPSHTNWDFQEVINRAVVERLGRDGAAAALLKSRLMESSDPSEIASLPRYLSAAGALDTEITQRCTEQLQLEGQAPIPRAAFDAVEGSVRSLARSLLDVVTPSLSA